MKSKHHDDLIVLILLDYVLPFQDAGTIVCQPDIVAIHQKKKSKITVELAEPLGVPAGVIAAVAGAAGGRH